MTADQRLGTCPCIKPKPGVLKEPALHRGTRHVVSHVRHPSVILRDLSGPLLFKPDRLSHSPLIRSLTLPSLESLAKLPAEAPELLPSSGHQLPWPEQGARETLYPLDPVSHGSAGGLAALPALILSAVGAQRLLPTLLASRWAGWTRCMPHPHPHPHLPAWPSSTPNKHQWPPPALVPGYGDAGLEQDFRGGKRSQETGSRRSDLALGSLHPLATKHPRHFLLQLRRPCYV